MEYCEFSRYDKYGMTEGLICTTVNQPCGHQRYCIEKMSIVHTDNWKNCVERRKRMGLYDTDVTSQNEGTIVEEKKENTYNNKSKTKSKNTYKVLMVTPKYVIVDKDGQNFAIKGKFNYKVGEFISI